MWLITASKPLLLPRARPDKRPNSVQKLATQAVILAAGQGVRMRAVTDSKPLLTLLGMRLLERLIRTLHSCGVDVIIIVACLQHQAIQTWLETFRTQLPGRQPQF